MVNATVVAWLKRHKLIWNTVQDFANNGIATGRQVRYTILGAGLGSTLTHSAVTQKTIEADI